MVINFDEKTKAMVSSYVRSAVASGLAVYTAGARDTRAIVSAGVSALIPPLVRWLNKADTAFGRGSK